MSARLNRLETVVRSGPTPSPSLPYLWHLMQLAFSKTTRPRAESPGAVSRYRSRSSYLYLDPAGGRVRPVLSGGSLGKVWLNHSAHCSCSCFHCLRPGAPKERPVHCRSSCTASQLSSSLVKVGAAWMATRKGPGSSALGLTSDCRRAVRALRRSTGFLD